MTLKNDSISRLIRLKIRAQELLKARSTERKVYYSPFRVYHFHNLRSDNYLSLVLFDSKWSPSTPVSHMHVQGVFQEVTF